MYKRRMYKMLFMATNTRTARPRPRLRIIPEQVLRRRLNAIQSQEVLAEKAGISPSALSYIETGKRGATFETVQRLARALKCDPLDIAEVVDA